MGSVLTEGDRPIEPIVCSAGQRLCDRPTASSLHIVARKPMLSLPLRPHHIYLFTVSWTVNYFASLTRKH